MKILSTSMSDFWFVCVFLYVVQLVKLLEQREANHIEFCRIKNLLDDILQMYKNSELNEILKLLMDPTWVATGLKIDFERLVSITPNLVDCICTSVVNLFY